MWEATKIFWDGRKSSKGRKTIWGQRKLKLLALRVRKDATQIRSYKTLKA